MISQKNKDRIRFLAGIKEGIEKNDIEFDISDPNKASKELFSIWKTDRGFYKDTTNDLIEKYQNGDDKERIRSLFKTYFTTTNQHILKSLNNYNKEITNKEGDDFWVLSILNSLSGQHLSPSSRSETGMNHISNFDLLQNYSPIGNTFDDYLFSTLENSVRQYLKLDKDKVKKDTDYSERASEEKNNLGNVDLWDFDMIDIEDYDIEGDVNDIKSINASEARELYNVVKTIQKMAFEYLKTVDYNNAKPAINWYEDNTVEGEDSKQLIDWIPNWDRYDFRKNVFHNWIKSIIIPEYIINKYKIDIPGYKKEGSKKEMFSSNMSAKKFISSLSKANSDLDKEVRGLMYDILSKDPEAIQEVSKYLDGDAMNLLNIMNSTPKDNLHKFISSKPQLENIIEIARSTINMLPHNILSITNYDKSGNTDFMEGWISKNKDRINSLVSDELFMKIISLSSKKPKIEPSTHSDENNLMGAKSFYRALAITNFKWRDAVRQAKERERAPKKSKGITGIPTDDFNGMFESSSKKF